MASASPPSHSEREAILGNIRAALGRRRGGLPASAQGAGGDNLSPSELRQRLSAHADAPKLSRLAAAKNAEERLALFLSQTASLGVKTTRLAGAAEIPAHLAALCAELGAERVKTDASGRYSLAVAPALRDLPWKTAPALQPAFGAIRDEAKIAVQQAFAGIAETGSLMVCSSPAHPTTLNFLGDVCLVVLNETDIVPDLESAWQKWRGHTQNPSLGHNQTRDPRLINIITGPSRTADIEGKILLGAHGPAELRIFLVAANHAQNPPG